MIGNLKAVAIGMILAVGVLPPVHAQVLVSPKIYTTTEGNIDNGAPFNLVGFGDPSIHSMRYQQVYKATDFSSLKGASYLHRIAFRPDANYKWDGNSIVVNSDPFTATYDHVRITFSTTSKPPEGLSLTFSENLGTDEAVSYDGPLTLTSSRTGPAGGPFEFDIIIPLSKPFLYYPLKGNLLIDIQVEGNPIATQFDAIWDFLTGTHDSVSRTYNKIGVGDVNSLSGEADSAGLITQFTFSPAPPPDLLLSSGGALYRGVVKEGQQFERQTLHKPSSDWEVKGSGDFNNDGYNDILFQHKTAGSLGCWTMNGATVTGWQPLGHPSPAYTVQGVGDFNHDGSPDILFQNTQMGVVGVWLYDNENQTLLGYQHIGSPTPGWIAKGAGDFNGDGYADVLFQSPDFPFIGAWLWNGSAVTGWRTIGYPATGLSVKGVDDHNRDGRSDVYFVNEASGDVSVALWGGGHITRWVTLGTTQMDNGYSMVGTIVPP